MSKHETTTSEAALRLLVTPRRVRQLVADGRIRVLRRIHSRTMLLARSDVERVRIEMAEDSRSALSQRR